MDQRGVAADEIDTDRSRSVVDGASDLEQIALQPSVIRETGVIEMRLLATLIPNSSPISSTVCTSRAATERIFVTGFLRDTGHRVAGAIEQAQTERNCAHVEMLHLGHRDGLKDLGLGVFHLSDHFAENEQHEKQQKNAAATSRKRKLGS